MATAQSEGGKPSPNKTTMTFRFPGTIEQVSYNTVQMHVEPASFPALNDQMVSDIMARLGERDGERFIEEQTERINRELVLRAIF